MAWHGYNDSAFNDLKSEIRSSKNKINDKIDAFNSCINDIEKCWVGVDSDSYRKDLQNAMKNAKESVNDIFTSMTSSLQRTYDDWVNKQKAGK